jgi:hypothetical protein
MPSFNHEFNTFIKGLITEASPLTYPENSSLDEINFVLDRDGSRSRRKGMDYEKDYNLQYAGATLTETPTSEVSTFIWDNVSQNENLLFGIVRAGVDLWFLDLNTTNPSASLRNQGTSLKLGSNSNIIDMTTFSGDLIVVDESQNITIVTYDIGTDTMSTSLTRLTIRDFFHVYSDIEPTYRPTAQEMTDAHYYNLYNQGWPTTNQRYNGGTGNYINYMAYPALTDDWSTAMGTDTNGEERFDKALLYSYSTENSKGHFVLDAFNRGNSRQNETLPSVTNGNLPVDSSDGGITSVTNFASRVWYGTTSTAIIGGDEWSPRISTFVFFSRITQSIDDIGKCYQAADPTSREISDLIDTDGGYIIIPEMNNIVSLVSVGRSLMVFAKNGVWEIRGSGAEESFVATSYQVNRLSNNGAVSKESIVVAEDKIGFWSNAGIYMIERDQFGSYQTTNMTETTIQTFYNSISNPAKSHVTGAYDAADRTIRWMYNNIDDPADPDYYEGTEYTYRFNAELVLDLTLGSWYKNTISRNDQTPFISGYFPASGFVNNIAETQVVTTSDEVVTLIDSATEVTIPTGERTQGTSNLKYLITTRDEILQFTLGEFNNEDFVDWERTGFGEDAPATLITGYFTGGDSQRDKQGIYITTHCKRTETGFDDTQQDIEFENESSCLMQPRWEWTSYSREQENEGDDTRWGKEQQVYRYRRLYLGKDAADNLEYPFDVITAKSKIRGKGKCLSLRFRTEPKKDLVLLGWGISGTMETN